MRKEILENNNLKIHIENGNIYYKNEDTNESILKFIKNQQGSSKGMINYDLPFEGSFKDYYKWILNDYNSYEKTKFDLLTLKNTKYLVYCFNDMLKSAGQPMIKIRHSKVTDDYLAAEEIQNQNWQHFIERVIEVCKSKEIGSTIKKSEDFLLTTVENVTMAKKSYESFYNIVQRNFYSTMQQLSVDEQNEIRDDFLRENFWWEDITSQLDSWVLFYCKFGRFLGSQKLVSIPKVHLPYFLKTDMPISPVDLYKNFAGTDAKALVSIHALAALNIHFGRNKYISQTAIGEYLQNLTYQALNQENDKKFMSFDNIGLLVNDLLEQFVRKENTEIDKASVMCEKINNKLKTNFQSVLSAEIKIQKGEEDKEIETKPKPIDASAPLKKLGEFYETEKETFLKTALTINQTDLETATDAADADSEALFEEIINPTPGYVIEDKINVDTQFDF